MSMTLFRLILLTISTALIAFPVSGQGRSSEVGRARTGEINILSGGGSVRTEGDTLQFTFAPNVSVTRGAVKLNCDKLVIVRNREGESSRAESPGSRADGPLNGVRTVTASGNVKITGPGWTAESSEAVYDNGESAAVLSRPVKVLWEGKIGTCDRLVLKLDPNQRDRNPTLRRGAAQGPPADMRALKTAIASGNVKIKSDEWLATSGKAVYSRNDRTITFTKGPPRVWHGPMSGRAERIVYHLDEKRFEMVGEQKVPIEVNVRPGEEKREKK